MGRLRPITLAGNFNTRMTALFPKADVQNVRVGVELNDRFWPKAGVRVHET